MMPSMSGYFGGFVFASVVWGLIAAVMTAVSAEEHEERRLVSNGRTIVAVVAAVVVLAGLVSFVLYHLAWIDYKRRLPS